MQQSTCSVEDCGRRTKARGWCDLHYTRWRVHGVTGGPAPMRAPNVGSCSVEGCGQPMRKRTWCAAHYSQWTRKGEVQPFKYKWADIGGSCEVCGEPVASGTGRRKHCSNACQVVASRTQGSRPTEFRCRLCGEVVSLKARDKNGRLLRTDAIWCGPCGRSSPDAMRFKLYGVTPERYAEAVAAGCDVCHRIEAVLHVDHDHSCCSGRKSCGTCTRGFLCGSCNRALGLFRDDVIVMQGAIDYLTNRNDHT